MRVTTAFSRLLNLRGVWVRQVHFEPDRVVLEVALKRRRLLCPLCEYSTASRKDKRPVDSIWRHLDLGIWRLEIHCRRRRLWCPERGARTEGVPFARPGSEFTRDFECLVGWLATRTDKTTIKAMLRIDWDTVGRIVKRVCDDELDPGRLNGLFDIGIDEVSWKRQHNYLTLVADHLRGKIVWGTDGAGEKAADRFFEELDPEIAAPPPLHADPGSEDGEPTVGERAAKLRAISLDRGHGCAASARKHAPQAVICIDPYHVVFGLACGSIVLTWLYNGTGGSILACAVWHGLFKPRDWHRRRHRDDSGGHEHLRLRPSVLARRARVARAQAWRSIDPRPPPKRRAGVQASYLVDTVSSQTLSFRQRGRQAASLTAQVSACAVVAAK